MPLIDYTLEFLAKSGVKEVYIYPGPDTTDEVDEYIRSSKWNPRADTSPFEVAEVIISKATSIGEAMRDVDRRKVISGDFLVVHGDMVSTVDVDTVIQKHKARRAVDKNFIMTMVVGSGDCVRKVELESNISPIFVVNKNGRCLHYEEINPLSEDKRVRIPADVLLSNPDLEIRADLVDCRIDICTPDILALWTEEFDYQEPRQFLHGILKDYELNGKTIYIETVDDSYSARVNNLQAYNAISRDVIYGYTWPIGPTNNILPGQTYNSAADGAAKENGVVLSRASHLGNKTVVGRETSFGSGAYVQNSTIGRRCQIGKNVVILDSYIWDDVMIGDGTVIEQSIIASEAAIGSNAKIRGGTVISFGACIGSNFTVKEGYRITKGNQTDVDVVGEGGEGHMFVDEEEPEEEGDRALQLFNLQNNLLYRMIHLNISAESISTFSSEIVGEGSGSRSRRPSIGSDSDDDDSSGFHEDAVQGLYDTLQENGDFDSAKLEFMGLRLSNDASDREIRHAIAEAFTKNMFTLTTEDKLAPVKAVHKTLDTPGATQFLKEVGIGKLKVLSDQVEFLLEVQKYLSLQPGGADILYAFCHELYEREVIEEDGFEFWWDSEKSTATEEMVSVRVKAEAFLTWLREAEEEDSDENED